ncbi:TRAP transporter substrate-binding protein [Thermodesulfobacteriota bacterium]
MKKVLLGILSMVLAIGGIIFGCANDSAAEKTFNLRLAHHLPPMHQQHKRVFIPWAQELEKRTGGRVKVKVFPSQQLGSAFEMYDLLISGTADISMVQPPLSKGRFPLDEIFHLPFFIPGDTGHPLGAKIRTALYEKYLLPIHFKEVKCLWTGRFGLNVIFTTKKPVRRMEDMKGMVIGVPGGRNLTRLIQAVGASPESSHVVDMYTNLERGVIDGQSIPLEAMVAFKLNEVAKYVTRVNAGGATFLIAMNPKTWNSLPPDIQKTIDGMRGWTEMVQAKAWAGATRYSEIVAKKSGIELIDFSPEEKARWVEIAKPLDALWVKEMDGRGFPATEMYKFAEQMLQK